ncbi:MAG TPA: transglycosylase domain-containing protein [Acidimicrobiales bacterium]|nr:transglycosylase domain-containing protein [Acidimicrobiales bacterium]
MLLHRAPGDTGASAAEPAEPTSKPKRRRRWLRWLGGAFLIFLLLVGGAIAYLWSQPFPKAAPEPQATVVYDAGGKPLATFSEQYRVEVPLSQVPPVVVNAVVSTEDRHFFTEGALNPTSIVRAAFDDITGRGGLQGGSTITQQYVKQAYLNSKRTLVRKIKEAALAIRLSQKESKKQILGNYLNIIYWGRGAYGVEAASRVYFGKDVGQLGLREASLLAGLIREPETADPAHDPALARKNQTETLNAMVRDKKITRAQAVAVENTPFSSYVLPPPSQVTKVQSQLSGQDYFLAAVRQQLYAKYGRRLVDGGGLRVTTTLDPTLQQQAYNSVYGKGPGALNPAGGDPSAALVSVDDQGRVRALVGGQNYARSHVDLALGAAGGGSGRQAGSTFKAFMLAELIKEGYSVQSVVPAPPKVELPRGNANGSPWVVTNYEGESVAPYMNIVQATAMSINTVYAQVVARIGAAKLDSMAEAMGINPRELKGAYPSQVLGSAEVSPIEMAAAYATFADGGVYHAPVLVTKVTTASGRSLPLPVKPSSRKVLDPAQAATESYVLQQVVRSGTGAAAGNLPVPVAGKTGTTQNAGDAWFIGYTPKLTTAVWMGYAASDKSMDGFRGISGVSGGSIPAQLWHSYMAAVLRSDPGYGGLFPSTVDLGGQQLRVWPLSGDQILVSAPNATPVTSPPTAYLPPPPSQTPLPTYIPPTSAAPATTAPTYAPPTTAAPAPPTTSAAPPTTSPTTAPTPTTTPPPPTTAAPTNAASSPSGSTTTVAPGSSG